MFFENLDFLGFWRKKWQKSDIFIPNFASLWPFLAKPEKLFNLANLTPLTSKQKDKFKIMLVFLKNLEFCFEKVGQVRQIPLKVGHFWAGRTFYQKVGQSRPSRTAGQPDGYLYTTE